MRRGINVPPFTDAATVVSLAIEAEEAGWDGVFLWDHLVWDTDLRLDVHDPWVLLGAMASRTERVRLGPLVTPLSRRRPWVMAKHVATLDHLSGGRAVLGVGLGAPPDSDFAAFGELSGDGERAAILDDALSVVDRLFRGPVEANGRFEVQAELLPRPVQQPRPPIWVAGRAPSRRPLARALRWDGVVPLGSDAPLTPAGLDTYLSGVDRPDGWDVVVARDLDVPVAEYEDVGVTWLIDSTWPEGDWVPELRARVGKGPQ